MDKVSIEDFSRIELRVATIQKAEEHPRADRLLVLQVDLGDEQRQLVAGIRGHYAPEELIGKQGRRGGKPSARDPARNRESGHAVGGV
jgi:methionyl-tRNA synthetase